MYDIRRLLLLSYKTFEIYVECRVDSRYQPQAALLMIRFFFLYIYFISIFDLDGCVCDALFSMARMNQLMRSTRYIINDIWQIESNFTTEKIKNQITRSQTTTTICVNKIVQDHSKRLIFFFFFFFVYSFTKIRKRFSSRMDRWGVLWSKRGKKQITGNKLNKNRV